MPKKASMGQLKNIVGVHDPIIRQIKKRYML
jgi:hypothetical protein